MPSNMIFTAATAVLSLSGMATALVGTAPYQSINATTSSGSGAAATGAYSTAPYASANATTSSSKAGSTATTFHPDLVFCPGLNNQVFTDARGHHYVIECGLTHKGIFIDIVSTGSKKRAAATTLNDCLLTCDEDALCIATSYNRDTQQCAYFSEVGEKVVDGISEFAYVTNLDGTTVTPGAIVPSTVYTTTESTIYSCPASVTNCPLRAGVASAVVTDTIALYTTVCPYSGSTTSTVAAAAVACTGCAVSAGTATVYSATVSEGTTTVVPVATAAVNYINPSGSASAVDTTTTVAAAYTIANSTANASAYGTANSTATVSAAYSTASVEAFTGAAGHVEAGMGMAAVMAMAVLAL